MGTRNSRPGVPVWAAGLVVALVGIALAYVFVYGGSPTVPVAVVFGAFGVAVSLFTLYLLYRFVVAVETIAEKH
ncbi:MAG: hypothetical protein ABEJ85_05695 [Haloarculaceae archaeon]